jgi:streptogramin lyase
MSSRSNSARAATSQWGEFTRGLLHGSKPGDDAVAADTEGGMVAWPDGDLWFTDEGKTLAIGRVTPAGRITEFTGGLQTGPNGSTPLDIIKGPDDDAWFVDQGA